MITYLIILAGVLIISPFILKIALRQDKKTKSKLRIIFLTILSLQLLAGFLNWENTSGTGRSGYQFSVAYPESLLGLFFMISAVQILLLSLLFQKGAFISVVLNFINSILLFAGLIRLSAMIGFQLVSLAGIGTVFLVLIGNVVSLSYVNKDLNLLKKYYRQ